MPIVIPNIFAGNQRAIAEDVNENFDAIKTRFDAGIRDGDIQAGPPTNPGIDGDKLALSSIPGTRLEPEAVTSDKLANDPLDPGSDSGRAVSGDHIRTLTTAHVTRILPLVDAGLTTGIGTNKLKIKVLDVPFGPLSITVIGGFLNIAGGAVPPTPGTFPAADYDLLGFYQKNVTHSTGVIFYSISQVAFVTGGNWTGSIINQVAGTGAGTISGILTYVFGKKV